ncbi:DNA methyltransferase 1-associated protein 1-like protein [Chrysochromulina tobinii]|uniref:DNA methyltransferase 1-associated protein 1-like protein n=1 Tax=Chrysochromulina tobinii TaxID=1460289 RepID=A0A0M0J8T2_9EUKA|nr:DNA methyltransferase 1-associated protein 1-like protein [Chrysochromulina tobinii]|eukprot:KOO22767.1 DNA methyltransferase 1-associated protein 1-like protein [Chrysochromulina sp. CCMP291]
MIQKPAGMSREVFALLVQDAAAGKETAVPLVPTAPSTDAFKERKTRVTGWEHRKFTNAAREDGLVLRHWSKLTDKSTAYTFARFNKKCKILTYTDEEYDRHLTHPAWDRTETALLFDLCRRFDLRWPVIHDRFPEGRTMEQLKERYYEMCRLLLAARSASAADGTDYSQHPLATFRYDAKHERERKSEFERLYARSEEEANLSANGLGGNTELALAGLPSLAGLMDRPLKHRNAEVWLRSKDLSNKRPASDKLANPFERRMQELRMPVRPLPTELNINLYNQCRAHVVLLVELEAKLEKLEAERAAILQSKMPQPPQPPHHGGQPPAGAQKRVRDDAGAAGSILKRSHH